MKILFLDVDGVLNCDSTTARIDTHLGKFTGLDPRLVKRLLEWLKDKNIKIVLSSSWRIDGRFGFAFTRALAEAGIEWIDITPNLGHRGKDIAAWLSENPCTHYAILDDICEVRPCGRCLVQTSPRSGLQDKHLRKLEALLELTT